MQSNEKSDLLNPLFCSLDPKDSISENGQSVFSPPPPPPLFNRGLWFRAQTKEKIISKFSILYAITDKYDPFYQISETKKKSYVHQTRAIKENRSLK